MTPSKFNNSNDTNPIKNEFLSLKICGALIVSAQIITAVAIMRQYAMFLLIF